MAQPEAPAFPEPSFLYKRDEGYCLNSHLHPWPPARKPKEGVGKEKLEAEVVAELDAVRGRREARLLKAGYTDARWRRIMLRHYGEDYDGMPARARLRAEESDREGRALAVGGAEIGLTSRSKVHLDRAHPGNVAGIIEHCFGTRYFPVQLSPEQRRATWQLSPETASTAHTAGTLAPGRKGLKSSGYIRVHINDADPGQSVGRGDEGGPSPPVEEDEWAWTQRESPASRLRKLEAEQDAMEENLGLWEREILHQKESALGPSGSGHRTSGQDWKNTGMHTPQDCVIRISDAFENQSAGVPPEYTVASSQFPHRISGEYGQPRQHALRDASLSRDACGEGGARGGGGGRTAQRDSARVSLTTVSKRTKERWWSKYDLDKVK
jgi:hypothetical protein